MQRGAGAPVATASTLPVFLAQLTWNMAVAQASDEKKPEGPKTFTIRKTNQDKKADAEKKTDGRNADPRQPVRARDPLAAIRAATQPANSDRMTKNAQEAAAKRLSGAPMEIIESGPDSLILEGSEEDIAVMLSILEMLDTATAPKIIEYVALKNAQAKELAKTLQDVFSKIQQVGERQVLPEDKIDIIADAQTNGLYIAATEAKMAEVLSLIEQNEITAEQKVRNVKTIQLKNRRVTEAGETLKRMVAAYLKQKGIPADAIQVEIDAPTNSVFITAGETDLKFVEQIIEGLDAELPPSEDRKYQVGEADLMVVPLRVADADELGALLNLLLEKAATGDTPMKDFIRRFNLLDEHGEHIASIDLNRPVFVFGEKGSNSLIIASTRENCLVMKQVALSFDKEPARAAVQHQVITMIYADATEIATQLNDMLTSAESLTQRPGKSDKFGLPDGAAGALVYQAVIQADARTNQVVVIGRPEAVTLLTELAASLDIKGLDVMPFEIIELEYANASSLESALTDLIEKRAAALPTGTGANAEKAEMVVIKGDPRSKSLIIAARKERMEELRGLIAKLDVVATALVDDIRTITLRNGNATDMAEKLKTLWEERQSQQEGDSGFKLDVPAIVADARSNSLIVAASKGDFEAIEAVVAKIEALELNPMFQIYIVGLKHNSASQLAPAFTSLFQKRAEMRTAEGSSRPEDEVEIQVDEVTNSLIVAASRENIEVLRQKVAELDQEMGIPGQVEFFVCTNIDAYRVKDTLEELFADDGPFPRMTGGSDVIVKRRKVTITVDNRANMLIVSASPENMTLVRQIYTRMESVHTPWDVAITRLMTIQHGDAVRIAAQVQDHFDKLDDVRSTGSGENQQSGFKITVFSDERSNRIVIGGTKDGIDRAVVLVEKLDVPPGEGIGIQVYGPLRNAPVARVADMIRNVFEQRNQSRDQGGPQVQNVPVTIEPNERNQTMLISASREDHALIKDVIDRLDRPSALLEMVRLFPLKESRAEKVKEILDELFQAAGGTGSDNLVGVTVDNRTNAVLVTGPPGELDNIEELIKQLDTAEPIGAVDIRVYRCENEDASKMVDLLNEILTGTAASGGGGQEIDDARSIQNFLVRYEVDGKQGLEVLEAMQQNVRISYNERSNTVVVVAPPASQRLMKSLIHQLDRIEKRAVLVKVFTLINADATRMVELLESMFAQDSASEQERAFQQGREFEVEGGISSTGVPTAASQVGTATKGTFGRPKTTFTADERTNSVVAAGWPEDIDIVADIIDQLDSQSIDDRVHKVYTLVNAEATAVESAVQAFWQAESQRLQSVGDQMSPQRRMEQEVSVVAHEESNQLIVSVAPRYEQSVLSIIEQLDLPPAQVMIQVMIAEVTLDDRFELGLEFALQQLRFSETAVANANGILQSTHFDVVGGTDLGAAGAGLGGFSFTITGEDFNFLLRALQADSRLEIIQRPMIMCQDNMEANISIGQRVPFIRGTQSTGAGQVNSTIEYEDIGIILDVEPHINPDGWVYLRIAPEVSSLTDSTIDIGNGVTAPVFNSRTADTTVAVRDGETVVIGGLITTSETEAESKVPLLGDIPGLGVLFRTTRRIKQRTELLIAMTPRIVRTVEDGRRMSYDARDESGIITPEMKQSPLFQGLRVVPEDRLDGIDTPPDLPGLPPEPVGPRQYGPSVPKYGPLLPDDTVITRNDTRRSPTYGASR
ncbi:MAG: hypothetical protein O7B26_10230 [Planctomycetota bacterium]|nr:hypothetical protein [Planctomycetota bacterium]